jgi:hypothetical protein
MLAMRISSPQGHPGNSVEPGTNKRSIADIRSTSAPDPSVHRSNFCSAAQEKNALKPKESAALS